jgi:alkylhydroperoxidase/carboxymuconolactone decarboxylase family protein YurZ
MTSVAGAGTDAVEDTPPSSFPEYELLRRYLPDYDRLRRAYATAAYDPKESELPLKFREILGAAILCYRGYPTAGFHFRRAIVHGATMREILEAVQCVALSGGSPTLHFALAQLGPIQADLDAGRPLL